MSAAAPAPRSIRPSPNRFLPLSNVSAGASPTFSTPTITTITLAAIWSSSARPAVSSSGTAMMRTAFPASTSPSAMAKRWRWEQKALVLEISGHTIGHIAYWFGDARAVFCGDTLFSLGCGRLFEGTPGQMWSSLAKLRALPGDTRVYCGHEYTESNARFALALDPENPALRRRADEVRTLRAEGRPTVPSTLAVERRRTRSCAPTTPPCRRRLASPAETRSRRSPRSAAGRTCSEGRHARALVPSPHRSFGGRGGESRDPPREGRREARARGRWEAHG